MITQFRDGGYIDSEDPGEPQTREPRISITDEEGKILSLLSRGLVACEIGTGLGQSAKAMIGRVTGLATVDPDRWVHENIWPKLPSWVETRVDYPQGRFGFVFIDGDHSTEAVKRDLAWAEDHATGMIVVHDAKLDSVAAALDSSWTMIDTYYGLALKFV